MHVGRDMDFLDKINRWFFDTENRYIRSAVCLIGMVATAADIYYVCVCPFDTVFDLVKMGVAVLLAMVLLAVTWTLLEYIIKHD